MKGKLRVEARPRAAGRRRLRRCPTTSGARPARRSSTRTSSSSSATRRRRTSCIALDMKTGADGLEDDARRAAVVGHADRLSTGRPRRARHQRPELHPRLRPDTGKELWRLGRQLQDHRADAGLRRRPDRRRQRPARPRPRSSSSAPGAAGDITLAPGQTASRHVAWSKQAARLLHADAARSTAATSTCSRTRALLRLLRPGDRRGGLPRSGCRIRAAASAPRRWPPTARSICRARTATSSSSRPGRKFELLATNPMGEPLMATPAISGGTMFVRGAATPVRHRTLKPESQPRTAAAVAPPVRGGVGRSVKEASSPEGAAHFERRCPPVRGCRWLLTTASTPPSAGGAPDCGSSSLSGSLALRRRSHSTPARTGATCARRGRGT